MSTRAASAATIHALKYLHNKSIATSSNSPALTLVMSSKDWLRRQSTGLQWKIKYQNCNTIFYKILQYLQLVTLLLLLPVQGWDQWVFLHVNVTVVRVFIQQWRHTLTVALINIMLNHRIFMVWGACTCMYIWCVYAWLHIKFDLYVF